MSLRVEWMLRSWADILVRRGTNSFRDRAHCHSANRWGNEEDDLGRASTLAETRPGVKLTRLELREGYFVGHIVENNLYRHLRTDRVVAYLDKVGEQTRTFFQLDLGDIVRTSSSKLWKYD